MDSPITLNTILYTLIKVSHAKEVLNDVLLSVWRDVIKPLWRERKLPNPRIYTSPDSDRAELLYDSINKDSNAVSTECK